VLRGFQPADRHGVAQRVHAWHRLRLPP
jgi:hypothetical protein